MVRGIGYLHEDIESITESETDTQGSHVALILRNLSHVALILRNLSHVASILRSLLKVEVKR